MSTIDEYDALSGPLLARLGLTTENNLQTIQVYEAFERSVGAIFNDDERNTILQAMYLSTHAHAEQLRADGGPYVEHPIRVAQRVIDLSEVPDKDAVVAALLHDMIEDQSARVLGIYTVVPRGNTTIEDQALGVIESKFGSDVASFLRHLTNPDFAEMLAAEGIDQDAPEYQKRKRELYAEHVADIIKDPTLCVIKFADFSQNGLDLRSLPDGAKKTNLALKYRPVMYAFLARIEDQSKPRLNTVMQAAMIAELQDSIRHADAYLAKVPLQTTSY